MSEPKKASGLGFVIVLGAVVALCCVSSVAAATLFGFAAPTNLLSGFERSPPPGVVTARVAVAPTGIEGEWLRGSGGLPEYRDANTGRWNAPTSDGQRYLFREDGTCEMDAMMQTASVGCTSYLFTSTTDCRWSLVGTQLTVELGEGLQVSKMCGGDVKKTAAMARTVTSQVTLNGDRLSLAHPGATLEFQRAP